ncbi:superoxide dismutase family protein [Chitinasiproducens palmae]|uniref:Superoxide dismutase, Cu-Zn family n=1 Tax=Chitinasiproducens palmae TaxID=1770053 RepID=A0A1H2PTE7_9BURK|nr:superoxide dismutase family protein [Chitinasiproducens palmae]SDV49986.1 superoxide dismutase, Cu-Zn family [Chitinasiproducens palmae]
MRFLPPALAAAALVLAVTAHAQTTAPQSGSPQTPPAQTLSSDLLVPGGKTVGKVMLIDAPKGVLVRIEAQGLPPGWHGMHFHEKGDCSDDKFMNSGGHVHGDAKLVHGLLNANATDSGDLPNLYVGPDGRATVELYSTLVSFDGATGRPALKTAGGRALVIHANPDDYTTQPIGGAGARIACAPLE